MPRAGFEAPRPPALQASLSVSQLNAQARQLLEKQLAGVWVEGEIAEMTAHASGHWYFTLKDAQSQLSCVMFRGHNQRVVRVPKKGEQVTLQGQVSLFEARGQYQFLVQGLRFSGEGDALLRLEALKKQLAAEGLFDPARKRPLPRFPQRIGVITSDQGAALQDVLQVIQRRWPLAEVWLYPAVVQGREALASLRQAWVLAQRKGQPDVLLLVRGGGSIEDLQAFNDEGLVRLFANSPWPWVSGIGHETDTTLMDFVSDLRAATPTAAAECVTPDRQALHEQLARQQGWLQHQMGAVLRGAIQALDRVAVSAQQLQPVFSREAQRLQQTQQRLQAQHPQRRLADQAERLQRLQQRLAAASPAQSLQFTQSQVVTLGQRLDRSLQTKHQFNQQQLGALAGRLAAMSPLNTLSRGYALVTTTQGALVRRADQVALNQSLRVRLGEGQLTCQVTALEGDQNP